MKENQAGESTNTVACFSIDHPEEAIVVTSQQQAEGSDLSLYNTKCDSSKTLHETDTDFSDKLPAKEVEKVQPPPAKAFKRKLDCPKWLIVGLVFTVALIIAIALLVFFLFPRIPDIDVMGAAGDVSSNDLTFNLDPISLQMNLTLNISVYNPNFMSINIKQANGIGYLPQQPELPVATSDIADIHIPLRSQTYNLIPVTITYTKEMHIDTLRTLLDNCNLEGPEKKQNIDLNLKLNATLEVIGLEFTFRDLSLSASFSCPIDASKYSGLTTLLDILSGNSPLNHVVSTIGNAIGTVANNLASSIQIPAPSLSVNLPSVKLPFK